MKRRRMIDSLESSIVISKRVYIMMMLLKNRGKKYEHSGTSKSNRPDKQNGRRSRDIWNLKKTKI